MGMWGFLALCVVCACALQAYRAFVKSKGARNSGVAALEARVVALETDLEERVRTLEAIVTDPKADLDREINKLAT